MYSSTHLTSLCHTDSPLGPMRSRVFTHELVRSERPIQTTCVISPAYHTSITSDSTMRLVWSTGYERSRTMSPLPCPSSEKTSSVNFPTQMAIPSPLYVMLPPISVSNDSSNQWSGLYGRRNVKIAEPWPTPCVKWPPSSSYGMYIGSSR